MTPGPLACPHLGQGPAFFDVVLRQRACRDFVSDPVPDEDVARMLEAAVHAPSVENAQPWVFVVVRDADRRRRITELTRRLWDGGAGDHSRPRLAAGLFAEVDGAVRSGFGGAPVLVVVAGDGRDPTTRATLGASVFPAVQTRCSQPPPWVTAPRSTTLPTVAAAELRDVVELPEGLEPMAVVPIGLPARSLGRPRRLPPAAKTHLDRYEA